MLAEQHCVCTKSGLKNVSSTRCVAGRRGEGGIFFFFLKKMVLEHRPTAPPLPSRTSFPILSEVAGSAALRLLTEPSSGSFQLSGTQSAPGYTLHHQKDRSANSCRTGCSWAPTALPATPGRGAGSGSRHPGVQRNPPQPHAYTGKFKEATCMLPAKIKGLQMFRQEEGQKNAQKGGQWGQWGLGTFSALGTISRAGARPTRGLLPALGSTPKSPSVP